MFSPGNKPRAGKPEARAGTGPGSRQPVTLAPAGNLSPGQKAGRVAGSR